LIWIQVRTKISSQATSARRFGKAMNVPISEAKARLTDLVRRAEAGDEVVLTRHGRPVVRLAPVVGRPGSELERGTTPERVRLLGDA
jgi:prevent-host-death family protein